MSARSNVGWDRYGEDDNPVNVVTCWVENDSWYEGAPGEGFLQAGIDPLVR